MLRFTISSGKSAREDRAGERIIMFEGLKAFWKEIVTEYKKPEPAEEMSPAAADRDLPVRSKDPEPDASVSLTITQSFNDDGFEPIKAWLQADPRVTGETTEKGRHYSVPDRDDLPEWYAIRIGTTFEHQESLKNDLQKWIDTELDEGFTVEYFL